MVSVVPAADQASEAGVSLEVAEPQANSLATSAPVDTMSVVDDAGTVIPAAEPETVIGFVRRQASRVVSWFKNVAKGVSRMFSVNVPDDD